MPQRETSLVGNWARTGAHPCATRYPAHLRFEANGIYSGTTEPPGAFTFWDSGTWKVKGPGAIALSTANDAVVDYRFSLDGDTLAVIDPEGCNVQYRRIT